MAKIQQSLPEMKRDGNTVLGSVWADLIYADNSSSRAGGILPQLDFIPQLSKELQGNPDKVVADLQEIRQFCETLFLISAWKLAYTTDSDCSQWHQVLCGR